jgi:MT-A70/ParB-like nuclease domain
LSGCNAGNRQLKERRNFRATKTGTGTPKMRQAISSIHVGHRHRRDLGGIVELARSIADIGLLHPVVIRPDGTLIAGERRLRAAQHLGWTEVPVTIVDIDIIARGELAENANRKDFLPSEIDAIRRALMPVEAAAATCRKLSGRSVADGGETRDKIGAFAGVSGRTVDKIAAVVAAAEAEPERFGKLAADMDRTGRVSGVYKRLCIAKQAEQIRTEPPPLPGNGPYRVAAIDPPWPYEKRAQDPSNRATHPYPEMSIADICALDVAAIMAPDAIAWLWVTNHHMREAFQVLDAWGFEQKTILTGSRTRWAAATGCAAKPSIA